MNDNAPIILGMAFFIFLFGFLAGSKIMDKQWQKDAIKAGVAEWVADENGNAKFEFKTK
jgi:hypothetical protein